METTPELRSLSSVSSTHCVSLAVSLSHPNTARSEIGCAQGTIIGPCRKPAASRRRNIWLASRLAWYWSAQSREASGVYECACGLLSTWRVRDFLWRWSDRNVVQTETPPPPPQREQSRDDGGPGRCRCFVWRVNSGELLTVEKNVYSQSYSRSQQGFRNRGRGDASPIF